MAVPIVITTTVTQPLDMLGREYDRALKAGHEAQARAWKDRYLPLHFRADAKGRYHYQPRTRKYLIRKLRLGRLGAVRDGGLIDLVFSGQLREWVMSTPRITATKKTGRVVMTGPRWLAITPRSTSNHPDMAKEVLAITNEERQSLTEVLDQTIEREINSWRETQTETA